MTTVPRQGTLSSLPSSADQAGASPRRWLPASTPMGTSSQPGETAALQTTKTWALFQPSTSEGEQREHAPNSPTPPASERPMGGRAAATSSVRRLTPTECERLQGFPDQWTVP
jgi:site-specific DNA-cytosine methylase